MAARMHHTREILYSGGLAINEAWPLLLDCGFGCVSVSIGPQAVCGLAQAESKAEAGVSGCVALGSARLLQPLRLARALTWEPLSLVAGWGWGWGWVRSAGLEHWKLDPLQLPTAFLLQHLIMKNTVTGATHVIQTKKKFTM